MNVRSRGPETNSGKNSEGDYHPLNNQSKENLESDSDFMSDLESDMDLDSSPSETTQRFMEVDEIIATDVDVTDSEEKTGDKVVQKEPMEKVMEKVGNSSQTSSTSTSVPPRTNRTEKERMDLARYDDETFDDSNEFLFK